jgi:hypothetical protein
LVQRRLPFTRNVSAEALANDILQRALFLHLVAHLDGSTLAVES